MKRIQNLKFRIENLKGFTLIELLIVIAVVGLFSTLGVAAFIQYNHSQALGSATSTVVNMLTTARSRAQSQVKPQNPQLPDCFDDPANNNFKPMQGYEVHICGVSGDSPAGAGQCINAAYNAAHQQYLELAIKCNNAVDVLTDATQKMPGDISFMQSAQNSQDSANMSYSFFFPVLTGVVQSKGPNGIGDIFLQGYSLVRKITITNAGVISIQ
ncbi:MAG TPA: prepilin-type N-terminal cleavage/methylation domain-containing protein [Candidatus Saccharimonadales bacterium]|nr:prepilin-type N-terminal cleavage/methylation domain-containing protein [Candidatus Saccharimonadales bacterium]